ncbi:serine hydrolase [Rubrivirga sp. S365]|uniref:beta-lactamase n=1 Tax=Rubrivirga litoralis TaxID=3075598 RepID=A0ABU3BV94_9BACT|nr:MULTISPECIES: serine hydrolase [unclassified Rubrivirga]MDT0633155.1 serine hydrolase [Rubrivirga sp. F394]MDT7857762.1 serine hydrolase [Rubrivirga sp. S365]
MPTAAPLLLTASSLVGGALVLAGCAAAPPRPALESAPARSAPAPPWPEAQPDAGLQAAVEVLVDGFDGAVGVYVRHLPTGREAALRTDERFPTASLIKVPILATLFDQVEAGRWAYDQTFRVGDAPPYPHPDVGLVGQLRPDATVALHQLIEMMLSASDNSASFWLQDLVGGGGAVNDWLADHGFEATRLNSRTPGREDAYAAYGWGQTTPREIAALVQRVVEGGAVSPAADLEMHRLLTRTFYDDGAVGAVPPGVQVASKQGWVAASRAEVVYVHAPSGPYVAAVLTRDQGDTRDGPDNAGAVLVRSVACLLWDTFEPGRPWAAPPGSERYRF